MSNLPTPTEIITALLNLIDAHAEPGDGQTCDLITAGDITINAYRRKDSFTLTLQTEVAGSTYTSLPIFHYRSDGWRLDATALLRVAGWLELVKSKLISTRS